MSATTSVHGGFTARDAAELGIDWREVLDLSANLAPIPAPEELLQVARRARLDRYPDPEYRALRDALSELLGVPAENVVPGNGAAELIHLVARLWLRKGSRVIVVGPTFSEYERAAVACGGEVERLWVPPGTAPDIVSIAAHARDHGADLLVICNPNNPTGWFVPNIAALCASLPPNLRILIDEAYVDFVPEATTAAPEAVLDPRLVVVRSFTKCFALPGVRLGCVVAAAEVADALRRLQPSWSVNAVAEAVGLALPVFRGHLERMREEVASSKGQLVDALGAAGFSDIVVGSANFLLIRVKDATRFRLASLEERICVRDCTSFGLAEWVRIAVPHRSLIRRVVRALAAARARTDGRGV